MSSHDCQNQDEVEYLKTIRIQLSKIEKEANMYITLHKEAYETYLAIYKTLSITNLIILCTNPVIKSAFQNHGNVEMIDLVLNIVQYFSAILASIIHFLEYEKIAESHNTKYKAFVTIVSSINRQITVGTEPIDSYYEWLSKKYNEIKTNDPSIPTFILVKFKKINKSLQELNSTSDVFIDTEALHQITTFTQSEQLSGTSSDTIKNKPDSNIGSSERYIIDRWMQNEASNI
jgi:hypothetical protein